MNLLIKGGVISLIIHLLIGGMIGIIVWSRCFDSDVIEIDLTQVDWHHEGIGGGKEGKGVERANSPILNSRQDVITTKRKLIDEKVAVSATNDTQIAYRKSRHTSLESFDRSDTALSNENQSSVGSSGNGIGMASGAGIGSGAQGNNGRGSGNGAGDGGGTKGGIKHYLSAHYNYIITRIQQHLIYPNQARMMGISGKAIYSFVIHQDGSIDALTLIKSAGLSALDEAGMRAIRRASPFPSPPAAARIKIPIVFSLH